MNEGVVFTFPTSAEARLKGNGEIHRWCQPWVYSPTWLTTCPSRLFQVKYHVTSFFPWMEVSGLLARHLGGDGPSIWGESEALNQNERCLAVIQVPWRQGTWLFFLCSQTDAEIDSPVLWPPNVKSQPIGKGPDAGKDWGQEEKRVTEDEMVGWHHWHKGHEFEQTRQ